jgi:hypothetical protein
MRYIRKTYVLDPTRYPDRTIDEFLFLNKIDGIYIDFKNTTANLTNVEVSIDEGDWIPATLLISGVEAYGSFFWRLRIRWLSSEDNKQIVLILCGEQTLKLIVPLQSINIVRDDVGLAKDSTLQLLTKSLRSIGGDSLLTTIYDSYIIVPVDLQARYKSAGLTLYSGTVTANGNTADIDVSPFSALEILLKVTGIGGTNPSLSVYIEGKFEATGDYKPLVYQEGITSTGTWFFTITQLIFRYIRVRWVVGGISPSFTFAVVAQAMV